MTQQMKKAGLVTVALVFALPVFGQSSSRDVIRLAEVAEELFPEVESRRIIPDAKPGEPEAILVARLRFESAQKRLQQASQRGRVFGGSAVAGEYRALGGSAMLVIRDIAGQEIGRLVISPAGKDVQIEVKRGEAEGLVPESVLSPAQVELEPVMKTFPLKD